MVTASFSNKNRVIKCECGFEIQIVPNSAIVGGAIDDHVEEHRRKQPDPEEADIAAKRVHDKLFKELFEKIVK
jgi:hypothetical protein